MKTQIKTTVAATLENKLKKFHQLREAFFDKEFKNSKAWGKKNPTLLLQNFQKNENKIITIHDIANTLSWKDIVNHNKFFVVYLSVIDCDDDKYGGYDYCNVSGLVIERQLHSSGNGIENDIEELIFWKLSGDYVPYEDTTFDFHDKARKTFTAKFKNGQLFKTEESFELEKFNQNKQDVKLEFKWNADDFENNLEENKIIDYKIVSDFILENIDWKGISKQPIDYTQSIINSAIKRTLTDYLHFILNPNNWD